MMLESKYDQGSEAHSPTAIPHFPASIKVTLITRLLSLAALSILLVDRPIASVVANFPHWTRTAASWISVAVSPITILPILLAISLGSQLFRSARPEHRPAFGTFGLCCDISAVASSLFLKNIIGRARPDAQQNWDPLLFKPFAFTDAFASMPSTQSALASAVTCAAAICFPRYRIPLLALGILICAARVVAGDHWTSDVIAGWTLGWLVTIGLVIARDIAARR